MEPVVVIILLALAQYMVLGGLVFSMVGDIIGRRPTIVMCTLAFGILTFLTGYATYYPALLALRFLDGLAIGGALPLAWALNVEFVPNKLRATIVAFIMMGFMPLGSMFVGSLGELIGVPPTVALGGALSLLVLLGTALKVPRLRSLE